MQFHVNPASTRPRSSTSLRKHRGRGDFSGSSSATLPPPVKGKNPSRHSLRTSDWNESKKTQMGERWVFLLSFQSEALKSLR